MAALAPEYPPAGDAAVTTVPTGATAAGRLVQPVNRHGGPANGAVFPVQLMTFANPASVKVGTNTAALAASSSVITPPAESPLTCARKGPADSATGGRLIAGTAALLSVIGP